jgi:tetratricopeptide (TPR) repeat protein
MNESAWEIAIKNLQTAMQLYKMQPEYNLAMGQCYMELGDIESAVQYFGNVVKQRPKSINGWLELLKCLYAADCFEEGAEYVDHALTFTNNKPVFYMYKFAFLLALGKSKEAMLQLENGMSKNPKLMKKLIDLNPALLNNKHVVDILVRYKKNKSA